VKVNKSKIDQFLKNGRAGISKILGSGVFWINIFEKMLNCSIKVIHYNIVSNPISPISV
jgi:hypothetical protein